MPMAGSGSRFSAAGFELPKPLLPLDGQPFFWWAVESVRRSFDVGKLVFVVLQEHCDRHGIDREIMERYSNAELVVLPAVTSGALMTAVAGCSVLNNGRWVVVNDCDHAFDVGTAAAAFPTTADGVLCHFVSSNPAYSYAEYRADGALVRTVEKRPISTQAIAGAYGFRSRDTFLAHAGAAIAECPYAEPFMSGVYNTMASAGCVVRGLPLDRHIPFGTPDEYAGAATAIAAFRPWLDVEKAA